MPLRHVTGLGGAIIVLNSSSNPKQCEALGASRFVTSPGDEVNMSAPEAHNCR